MGRLARLLRRARTPHYGRLREIDLPAPDVGTEIIVIVPAGRLWLPRSLVADLTAAGGGTRQTGVRFTTASGGRLGGANVGGSAAELVASGTTVRCFFSFYGRESSANATGSYTKITGTQLGGLGVPGLLLPGFRIRTQTFSLSGSDQWGPGVLVVEEFPL